MCEYHCHRSQKSINYSIYVYMCIYLQEMLGNDWNNVGDDHFYLFPCPFQSIIASTSIIYHVHNTYVLITFGPLNVKSFIVESFNTVAAASEPPQRFSARCILKTNRLFPVPVQHFDGKYLMKYFVKFDHFHTCTTMNFCTPFFFFTLWEK